MPNPASSEFRPGRTRDRNWGISAGILLGFLAGCGNTFGPTAYVLFTVPFTVEGTPVSKALIDTGGGFEVMLREPYGIEVVDRVEVLAFSGPQIVDVTSGFTYQAGGIQAQAEGAIVGAAACDCNALGIDFFRKTGIVLALDYRSRAAAFVPSIAEGGVTLLFDPPPERLGEFDSAFLEVELQSGDLLKRTNALLDSGAAVSALYRGTMPGVAADQSFLELDIRRDELGTVRATIALHDNGALPELIIGNDIMAAWGDRWYFVFEPLGGSLLVVLPTTAGDDVEPSPQTRRMDPMLNSVGLEPVVTPDARR